MTTEIQENQVCEACGCSAEMGFIIKEGDDVAQVTLYGTEDSQLDAELNKYVELAKTVSDEVQHETQKLEGESGLQIRFKFTCSAEKLIFELKTRSLAR